jgi:hypothetical protein
MNSQNPLTSSYVLVPREVLGELQYRPTPSDAGLLAYYTYFVVKLIASSTLSHQRKEIEDTHVISHDS